MCTLFRVYLVCNVYNKKLLVSRKNVQKMVHIICAQEEIEKSCLQASETSHQAAEGHRDQHALQSRNLW